MGRDSRSLARRLLQLLIIANDHIGVLNLQGGRRGIFICALCMLAGGKGHTFSDFRFCFSISSSIEGLLFSGFGVSQESVSTHSVAFGLLQVGLGFCTC